MTVFYFLSSAVLKMGHSASLCLPCLEELSRKFALFFSLWFCLEGVCLGILWDLKLFFLPSFFLRALFKPCRPGFIEKQVAVSGYPLPEVLFVLKSPNNKMAIDMKPGGFPGLTTCSINTFHRCATKGLDSTEGVTVWPNINDVRKHTLKAYY